MSASLRARARARALVAAAAAAVASVLVAVDRRRRRRNPRARVCSARSLPPLSARRALEGARQQKWAVCVARISERARAF